MHTKNSATLCSDAGFTLLEIIAVLVIMSILAVVAVPKYFDLQDQAREKAMATGKAEAVGRVNSYFAQQVLAGSRPDEIDYSNGTLGTNLGDFTLNVASEVAAPDGTGTIIVIDVAGRANTPVEGLTTTARVLRPGI